MAARLGVAIAATRGYCQIVRKEEFEMTSNVETLCADWLDAKSAEGRARELRIKIEGEIAQAFDVPMEGTKTHQTENYKVTMGQPITRKIDPAEWDFVKEHVPSNMHPVKVKIEADPAGCKYLVNNAPEMWNKIASAFTATPGKVSVKVEVK
jgi:hypothetical protein